MGSTAKPIEIGVGGMTCAACVRRVEKGLRKLPAVVDATVNLATERAQIRLSHPARPEDVLAIGQAIRKLGYEPIELDVTSSANQQSRQALEINQLWWQFLGSSVFTLPLLVISMVPMMSAEVMSWQMQWASMETWNWIMFGLAFPVQFGFGWRFLRLGLKSLLAWSPDMNALVLIGTLSAFGFSALVTIWPESVPAESRHVYFETSAVVITLVLLGKFLEMRSRHQASDAMKFLMRLVPKTAVVIRDHQATTIPVEEVRVGDLIQVAPGSAIAVDGRVESGTTYVDESMVTGEPVPVSKQVGDEVISGAINTTGTIQYRATAVGAETTLAKIVAFVESAQATKPRIQGLADRVVAVFVPVVLVIAGLTALAWLSIVPAGSIDQALVHAVAVLIIACPCAMGLAVPTSVMVGTGKAAQYGLLFRSTEAIQSLSEVDVVAFDKTGTLTLGKPQLVHLQVEAPFDEATLLANLAAVELRSEHPLASAIVHAAQSRKLVSGSSVAQFRAIPGAGVEAKLNTGETYLIGSEKLMQEHGVDIRLAIEALEKADSRGFFLAAVDGRLAAVLIIADPLKTGAANAVKQLQADGIQVALISGDNRRTTQAVAAELGIDPTKTFAEARPTEKAEVIRALQPRHRVAFVGDGLNDAPALTVANVGIAMGTGTDLAIETADVIAMSGDPQNVGRAIRLAQAVMVNIRQNLVWAFGYNAILIPLATGVFKPWLGIGLSPLIAGVAMSLSSCLVVSNALRLRNWR